LTYDLTIGFAHVFSGCKSEHVLIPTFSGTGTDSSGNGRIMWARVKGKTESDLGKLGFKQVYAFRPGYLSPTKGPEKHLALLCLYRLDVSPFSLMAPGAVSTLRELGLAMLEASVFGLKKHMWRCGILGPWPNK
jgi:hypothetical protein